MSSTTPRSGRSRSCVRSHPSKRRLAFAIAGVVEALAGFHLSSADAANLTLNGNDAGGTSSFSSPLTGAAAGWTDGTTPGQAPSAGNTFEVLATTQNNYLLRTPGDANPYTFAGDSLQLDAQSRFLLKGTGTITIANLILNGGNVDLSNSAPTDTLAGGITLADATSSSIFAETGSQLTISSSITGTGNVVFGAVNLGMGQGAVTLSAAGTVILSGTNTYTGTTTINAGTVQITTTGALAGDVTINSGGTFDTNGQDLETNGQRSFTIAGPGVAAPGAIINTSNAEGSIHNLTLAGNATIGTSAGKLNIYGTAITLAGHTLAIAGTGQTDVRTDGAFADTGSVVVNSGLLRLESSQPGTGVSYMVNAGATIDSWGTRTIAGNVTLNGGTLGNGNGVSIWSGAFTVSSASSIDDGSNQTNITGVISGSGDLTKKGSGTVTLSGANPFTGNITVNGGSLVASTGGTGPTSDLGNVSVARTITVNAGGTLNMTINDVLGRGQAASPINAGIVINGGTVTSTRYNAIGNVTLNTAGLLTQNATDGSGTAGFQGYQFTGGVTADGTSATTIAGGTNNAGNHLGANTNFNVIGTTGALTVTSRLVNQSGNFGNGNGGLTKTGAGTLALTASNNYAGGTNISAGTLAVTQASTGTTPLGSGAVTLAGGTLSARGAQTQLAAGGWNADVIHGAAENTTAGDLGTNADVDGAGFIFYEAGTVGAPQRGLPTGGAVVSPFNGILYQLQPYTANNDVRLTSGNNATLTLNNPGSFTKLHIVDTGGSGAANFSFTLNFADTTTTTVTGQTAPDWFNNTPFVDSDFGRMNRNDGSFQNVGGNPRLYETPFTLSPTDAAKTLNSITFNSTGGGVLNVFAVTADTTAQSYANNLIVTADSTLDVQSSPNASFGPLAIGANALTVTGIAGANATVGATSLSGNPTFKPAANVTLTLGAVGQDASARGFTAAGPGTVAVATSGSYTGGTTVSAGTLAVTRSSAGPSPLGTGAVKLAGGTLSVRSTHAPLAASGWNADVIHGAAENTTLGDFGTNNDVDGAGFIFYEAGSAGAPQKGLPTGGSVVSSSNGIVYQLQPYTANNDIRLTPGNSVALTLSSPGSFERLHIADTGGSGAASFSFTLNFADSTTTTVTGQTAPDWFNNTPFIDSDFGRANRNDGSFPNVGGNPRLYETLYTLSAADSAKTLNSISFNSTGGGILNVFAVTADPVQTFSNSVSVTADSTLDVQGTLNASFGPLAIGANTLSVTGNAGANFSLGATTLSGNAVFSPAANVTLTLGAVGQDASPRGLTAAGAGTVALASTNSYTGVTNITAGRLALFTATTNNIATSRAISVGTGATFDVTGVSGTNGFALASGQALGGTGTVAGPLTVGSGSTIAAGTSITLGTGTANATGKLSTAGETWNTGGAYAWKLNVASAGTSGTNAASPNTDKSGLNWDQLAMNSLVVGSAAGGFTIGITSIGVDSGTGSFDPNSTYAWIAANLPAAGGPANLAAANAALLVNAGGFSPPGGKFTALFETPSNDAGSLDLVITYSPAPEPTGLVLFGIGAGWILTRRRRRLS